MVLTKEEFKKTLKFIAKKDQQEDAFCTLLENMIPDSEILPAFIYGEYSDLVVRLLEQMFDDENGEIFHFLYDLEGIKCEKNGGIPSELLPRSEDKMTILYKDVDSLYDYLIKNMRGTK